MLTFDQIKELIQLVAQHRMAGLEIERSGFRLSIDGYGVVETAPASAPAAAPAPAPTAAGTPAAVAPASAPQAAPAASETAPAADDGVSDDAHIIHSPIVGTFYRRPDPDSDPFVEVGGTVKEGAIVCIIEAMKLMNEIESDVDGVVKKIFPKNGQPVEFGEPLFAIEPS